LFYSIVSYSFFLCFRERKKKIEEKRREEKGREGGGKRRRKEGRRGLHPGVPFEKRKRERTEGKKE